jgi:parallel beta-helix repeat protein
LIEEIVKVIKGEWKKIVSIFCVIILISVTFNVMLNTATAEGSGGGNNGKNGKKEYENSTLHIDMNIYEYDINPYDWKGSSPVFNAYFKDKSSDGKIVKFESDYKFEYQFEDLISEEKMGDEIISNNQNATASVFGTAVRYEDIYPETSLEFKMTLNQLKETFILNKLPENVNGNLKFSSKIFYDHKDLNVYVDGKLVTGPISTKSSIEFRNEDDSVVYQLPEPFARDTPTPIWNEFENDFVPEPTTIDTMSCVYKLSNEGTHLKLNLIVPISFLKSVKTTYPIFIDPSIENPLNSNVIYEGLYNGTIKMTTGSNVTYYPNVNNTIIQESNLTIQNGGNLTLKNIQLKMNSSESITRKIEVEYGGIFNVLENSMITAYNQSYEYDFYFNSASYGLINNSIIEELDTGSGGIKINSNNITITNSIIRNSESHGISIYSSNPNISNNIITNNTNYGIKILNSINSSISDNIISDNYIGIWINGYSPMINSNTIYSNNYGIYIYNTIKLKTITSNIFNNDIYSNSYGIYCEKNEPYTYGEKIIQSPAIFSDPVESTTTNWTHYIVLGSGQDLWHINSSVYNPNTDSTKSWHMGEGENYTQKIDSALESPEINLTNISQGLSVELLFWHNYEMEYNYDGGVVEITTDNGSNWTILNSDYDSVILYNDFAHSLVGDMAFTGTSNGWKEARIGLTPFVGNTIKIRFHFASDGQPTSDAGWFIDDIIVQKFYVLNVTTLSDISNSNIYENTYGIYLKNTSLEILNNSIYSNTFGILGDHLNYYENQSTIFSDDMESGTDGWVTTSESQPNWHQVTTSSHSTSHSWWCGKDQTGKYDKDMDNSLTSPSFDLSGLNIYSAELSFWHKYKIETNQDYGYVDISDDDGNNWDTLQGYTNTNGPSSFEQVEIDISEYIGSSNIKIRFRFVSDNNGQYEGWYIDDVLIQSGLYNEDYCNESIMNNNTITNNNYGVWLTNSFVKITNSSIFENSIYHIYIFNNSFLTFVNITYEKDRLGIFDNSQLIIRWLLNIEVENREGDKIENANVKIFDKNFNKIFSNITDSNGNIPLQILTDYIQSSSQDKVFYNPYSILINSTNIENNVTLNMESSRSLIIYRGGDSDNDGVDDSTESDNNVYWFEAEPHKYNNSQLIIDEDANNDYAIQHRVGNTDIINETIIHLPGGTYKFYMMAKRAKSNINSTIKISIKNSATTLLNDQEKVLTKGSYRWYGTTPFYTATDDITLIIEDDVENISNYSAYIDRFIFVRFKDEINNPTGIESNRFTDPLNQDTDGDNLIDGTETNEDVIWYEAEEFIYNSNQAVADNTANNGTSSVHQDMFKDINYISEIIASSGTYMFYLKARNNTNNTNVHLEVDVLVGTSWAIQDEYHLLSDTFEWYKTAEFDVTAPTTVSIYTSDVNDSNYFDNNDWVYVDKIMLVQTKSNETNWEMFGHDPIHSRCSDEAPLTNQFSWGYKNESNITIEQQLSSSPAVANGSIYFGDYQGYVYSLDVNTGEIKWSTKIGDEIDTSPALTYPTATYQYGLVIIAVKENPNSTLYALDRNNGSICWTISLLNCNCSSPTVSNNYIYFGASDGNVYKYDSNGNNIWTISPNGTGYSYYTPAVSDDKVYLGSSDYRLWVLNDTNQVAEWNYETGDIIYSSPTIYNNTVYFGSLDAKVYAVKTNNTLIWSKLTGDSIYSSPGVNDGKLIIGSADGKVYSFWENNGTTFWTADIESQIFNSSVAIADNKVFIGTDDNKLFSIDERNGDIIWSYETSGKITSSPAVSEGKIFVTSNNGVFYTFGSSQTDPFDPDIDSDNVTDGGELNDFYGYDRIETEDHISNFSVLVSRSDVTLQADWSGQKSFWSWINLDLNTDTFGYYQVLVSGWAEIEMLTLYEGNWVKDYEPDIELLEDVLYTSANVTILPSTYDWTDNDPPYAPNFGRSWNLFSTIFKKYTERWQKTVYWLYSGIFELGNGEYNLNLTLNISSQGWPSGSTRTYVRGDFNHSLRSINFTTSYARINRQFLNPFDIDNDNDSVDDGYEVEKYMYPLNRDPDEDGLSDPIEYFSTLTSPCYRDTDFDGIRDRVELGYVGDTDQYTVYDTSPSRGSSFERIAYNYQDDPDNKITNQDADNGSTTTDPLDLDTDDDGLPDGSIDGWAYRPITGTRKTCHELDKWGEFEEPNNLFQFWEGEDFNIDGAVFSSGWQINSNNISIGGETDPNNNDTDNDSLPDGWEVWYRISPLNAVGVSGANGDVDLNYTPYYTKYIQPGDIYSKLIQFGTISDNATNLQEFIAGTNPRCYDFDEDELIDGDEINKVIFRTNVPEGGLRFDNYGTIDEKGETEWIWINLTEYDSFVFNYNFTLTDSANISYSSDSVYNRLLFELYDDAKIYYNTSTHQELYIWDSNGGYYPNNGSYYGICHVYSIKMLNTLGNENKSGESLIQYRGQEIYTANPFDEDSDNDKLIDGEELKYNIDWDNDLFINVRDIDSDDEGLIDGEEIIGPVNKTSYEFSHEDVDGDGNLSMLDIDSDGDHILDNLEKKPNWGGYGNFYNNFDFLDQDGYAPMVDEDSDNDGLPDGWIDGWGLNSTGEPGKYNSTNGIKEWFEGEDLDFDGSYDTEGGDNGTETDPWDRDTDNDGLWDGIKERSINPSEFTYTQKYDLKYYDDPTYVSIGEWTVGTDPNNEDTDNDTVNDGDEVYGWNLPIRNIEGFIKIEIGVGNPFTNQSDGDNLTDSYEYIMRLDASNIDTDGDYLQDNLEIDNSDGNLTDPLNVDTDNDYSYDGWYDFDHDGVKDSWEGEDLDFDGVVDIGETNPNDPDSDDDNLRDGIENNIVVFRSNASNSDEDADLEYKLGDWVGIFLDKPNTKEKTIYYQNILLSSYTCRNTSYSNSLTQVYILPFQAPGSKDIYVSNNFSFCYIKKDSTNYYEFIWNHSAGYGSDSLINDYWYSSYFCLKWRKPLVPFMENGQEVYKQLSDPIDNDSDNDTLLDGKEFKYLGDSDIDSDNKNNLKDSDSDNDNINDASDLYYWSGSAWIEYWNLDFDGDGLPSALDNNSDNDTAFDGYEDSAFGNGVKSKYRYNGKYDNDTNENGILDWDPLDSQNFTGSGNKTETDPLSDFLDSDYDGLNDSIEDKFGTNKTDSDTDGDEVFDGSEIDWCYDTDSDGDINALDIDSDNDFLLDGYNITINTSDWRFNLFINKSIQYVSNEAGIATFIGELSVDTDPLVRDTDHDGLIDGDEIEVGSNPRDRDTDNDGGTDGFEVNNYFITCWIEAQEYINYSGNITMKYDDSYDYRYLSLSEFNTSVSFMLLITKSDFYKIQINPRWITNTASINVTIENGTVYYYNNSETFYLNMEPGIYNFNLTLLSSDIIYNLKEIVINSGLDPTRNDTDNDGVEDFIERWRADWPDTFWSSDPFYPYDSFPMNTDSDNDGLYDDQELENGTFLLNKDTDNDGVWDSDDIQPTTYWDIPVWEDYYRPNMFRFNFTNFHVFDNHYFDPVSEDAYSEISEKINSSKFRKFISMKYNYWTRNQINEDWTFYNYRYDIRVADDYYCGHDTKGFDYLLLNISLEPEADNIFTFQFSYPYFGFENEDEFKRVGFIYSLYEPDIHFNNEPIFENATFAVRLNGYGYQVDVIIPESYSPLNESKNIYRFLKIIPIWLIGNSTEGIKAEALGNISKISIGSVTQKIEKKSFLVLIKPTENMTDIINKIENSSLDINNQDSGYCYIDSYHAYILNVENKSISNENEFDRIALGVKGIEGGNYVSFVIIAADSPEKANKEKINRYWSGIWSDIIPNDNITKYSGNQYLRILEQAIVPYKTLKIPPWPGPYDPSTGEISSHISQQCSEITLRPSQIDFIANKYIHYVPSLSDPFGYESHLAFSAEINGYDINKSAVAFLKAIQESNFIGTKIINARFSGRLEIRSDYKDIYIPSKYQQISNVLTKSALIICVVANGYDAWVALQEGDYVRFGHDVINGVGGTLAILLSNTYPTGGFISTSFGTMAAAATYAALAMYYTILGFNELFNNGFTFQARLYFEKAIAYTIDFTLIAASGPAAPFVLMGEGLCIGITGILTYLGVVDHPMTLGEAIVSGGISLNNWLDDLFDLNCHIETEEERSTRFQRLQEAFYWIQNKQWVYSDPEYTSPPEYSMYIGDEFKMD